MSTVASETIVSVAVVLAVPLTIAALALLRRWSK